MGTCRFCLADPWIRVEDRLPEDDGRFLVVNGDVHPGDSVEYAIFDEGKFYTHLDEDAVLSMTIGDLVDSDYEAFILPMIEPTHWMPLPRPPAKTEKK